MPPHVRCHNRKSRLPQLFSESLITLLMFLHPMNDLNVSPRMLTFKYRQTQRVTVGRFQYYIFHLYPLLRSYF